MGKYKTLGSLFNRVFRNDLNQNFNDVDLDIQAQKERVDTLITGNPQPSEVVDARGGFPVLKDRLDDVNTQLAQIPTQTYITDKVKKGELFINVRDFGAVGNGVTNDTQAVKNAIASLKDGDTLYFPNTNASYLLTGEALTIPVPNITISGTALLKMEYGFRPTESGFTIDGLRMEATRYHSNARAVYVAEPVDGKFIKNFVVRNCKFKNFFYAADFRGGSYDVTGNETTEGFPVRDVVVENCYSETYTDQNTGHFNCTQVENVTYDNNQTYGGTTATSYNTIKGNGFIKVVNNYDENNAYGSCEIENKGSMIVISNNTFKKQIWIDDSSNAIIANNTVQDDIFISVANYGVDNILIANNTCARVKLDTYGTGQTPGMLINNVTIIGNKFINGASKTYGLYVNGAYVGKVVASNNEFPATDYTSGKIGGVRSATLDLTLRANDVNGNVVISGSGGKVTSISNVGATITSTNFDDGDTCSTLPTPTILRRGDKILLRKGTGVADEFYVCRKGATDAYEWKQVF